MNAWTLCSNAVMNTWYSGGPSADHADHTHNRIRSIRWTTSGRWNNVGKGIRQNESVTFGKGLHLRARHDRPKPWTRQQLGDCSCCLVGESGSSRANRGDGLGVKQRTRNWYEQWKSDYLIKTKHCDVLAEIYEMWFLSSALHVKVKKFNQVLVNGGSNYDRNYPRTRV